MCTSSNSPWIVILIFAASFFLSVWSCCIWVETSSQPFLRKWRTCPTSATWSCVTIASKVSPHNSPGNCCPPPPSFQSNLQCITSLQNLVALLNYLCVWLQAPLAAIFKSPQQLAHLPAKGNPLPGAPAGAQPQRQPPGGALCQGDDLRPALVARIGRTYGQERKHSLPPRWHALKSAAIPGPGQQVSQP